MKRHVNLTASEARWIIARVPALASLDSVNSVNLFSLDSANLNGYAPSKRHRANAMKLIIGNKNYSSWSLRGWLAAKQSGLAFEEVVVPLYGKDWAEARRDEILAPSGGKVPVLWDGEAVVWDSLAIIDYLADKVGRDRFWPKEDAARAMARSMVAEMHSSYLPLRSAMPMNLRKRVAGFVLTPEVRADVVRILGLWAEARARFGKGGPFLFGSFSAADVIYAPVVSRFITYGVAVPGFAQAYMDAVWTHDWMQTWIKAGEAESWVIEKFEEAAV
jgi:glutathione S-transferase